MPTLTADTLAHLGVLEDLTRQPRTLRELPEIRDELPELAEPHRKALADIPTPKAPEDRL